MWMAWLRGKKSQWTSKNLLLILLVIKDIFDRYLAIFGIFWGQFGPLQGQMLLLSFVDFFLWIKVVIVDSWYKQTKIEIVFWNTIYTRANHSEKEVQKCARYSFIVHTKVQLISKANSKLFTWTIHQQKHFCISALAPKSGQILKIFIK